MQKKLKVKPKVLILSGYGLNCEEDTRFAFQQAGGEATIVHINDLIEKPTMLKKFQILAAPGGFSYGDDTGSGKAYANKLHSKLGKHIEAFMKRDTLSIGICNGFQILTAGGFLPGALAHNDSARYIDRWVDVQAVGNSPWLRGIERLSLPIAHGEGRYVIDESGMAELEKDKAVAFRYVRGDMCTYMDLPANPNGAMKDIAGVLSHDGRVLGMMPHPERGISFFHRPDWQLQKELVTRAGKKINEKGDGMVLFENAITYFTTK